MKSMRALIEKRENVVVEETATVLDATQLMAARGIGAVPVLKGDRVVGIFTERDVMARVVAAGRSPGETVVAEVMSTNLLTGDIEDDHRACVRRMQQARVRHLLILEKGSFAGIVSLRDLQAVELDEQAETLNLLNAYVHDIPIDRVR